MKYSFIIPVKAINDYIREAIPEILKIARNDYEIIVYPDSVGAQLIAPLPPDDRRGAINRAPTRQIGTGAMGPAEKMSLAIRDAKGEILIFIDDDAYPEKNFLDILAKDFEDESVVAVGGPAITPKNDSFWQKVSGAFFVSALSGGYPERYVSKGKKRLVDDWPSVNLSVRKKSFEEIGGFNSSYWPGEDTKLCLDLLAKGGKIIYDPELVAYHHRRAGLLKHLRQVGGYGIHRGFFAKKYPQTSLKFKYFLPSFFLLFNILFLIDLVAYFLYPSIFDLVTGIFLLGYGLYFLALCVAFFDIYRYERNFLISLCALPYIFFSHLYYGWRFIQGFVFTKELKSKLR